MGRGGYSEIYANHRQQDSRQAGRCVTSSKTQHKHISWLDREWYTAACTPWD
jgi:hypothetical protein